MLAPERTASLRAGVGRSLLRRRGYRSACRATPQRARGFRIHEAGAVSGTGIAALETSLLGYMQSRHGFRAYAESRLQVSTATASQSRYSPPARLSTSSGSSSSRTLTRITAISRILGRLTSMPRDRARDLLNPTAGQTCLFPPSRGHQGAANRPPVRPPALSGGRCGRRSIDVGSRRPGRFGRSRRAGR
jgi:hypothetical protein